MVSCCNTVFKTASDLVKWEFFLTKIEETEYCTSTFFQNIYFYKYNSYIVL